MIVGNKQRFAIEAEPEHFDREWVLGRFRLWLCGHQVGNWDDCCALQGCAAWFNKFWQSPPNGVEPSIARMSPAEIFRLVVDPVFGPDAIADPRAQPVPFSYVRFHITYLGMSSLDAYVVILVKDSDGTERCLWKRHDDDNILECWLECGEMEGVAKEFCREFEALTGKPAV